MKITRRSFLLAVGALPLACYALAAPYSGTPQEIDIWRAEWHDVKRDRAVPVKIYYPKAAGPFPVIVFSHGLGSTRENYEYIGRYWASRGYASVHLQHIGSDDAVWRAAGGLQNMARAASPQNAFDRAHDVSFAIDQLEILNKAADFPLHGRLDLDHIGMAGHSFGANTTLMACGLKFGVAGAPSLADPRIKAAIAMSAPAPQLQNYDTIYGAIKLPMLHMTGTKDDSPLGLPGGGAIDRRLPFDHIRGADSYLVTFKDGDHMLFSGQRRGAPVATDDRYHALIQQVSTAFWDAYLRGDAKAVAWLKSDFPRELGDGGVFEKQP